MPTVKTGNVTRLQVAELESAPTTPQPRSRRGVLVVVLVVVLLVVGVSVAGFFYARMLATRYLGEGDRLRDTQEYTAALTQYQLVQSLALVDRRSASTAALHAGEIAVLKRDYVTAQKYFGEAQEIDPDSAAAQAAAGVAAVQAGDLEEATRLLQPLGSSYSQSVAEGLVQLAVRQHSAERDAVIAAATQEYPQSQKILFYKSLVRAISGKQEGVADLQAIDDAALQPLAQQFIDRSKGFIGETTSANQQLRIADALLLILEPQMALPYAEEALQLEPDYRDALITKAKALADAKQFSAARQVFAQAVERDPIYAPTHYHFARLLVASGDYALAQEEFKRARDLGAADVNFFLDFGANDEQRGDLVAAEQHYTQARNLDAQNIATQRALFWVLVNQGKTRDAATLVQAFPEAIASTPEGLALRALAALSVGDVGKANESKAELQSTAAQSPWLVFVQAEEALPTDPATAQRLFTQALDRDLEGQVTLRAQAALEKLR